MAESKLQREVPQPKAPMYKQSALYAISPDETDAYRASHLANVDCRTAIENAIAGHYRDNRLDVSFARDILEIPAQMSDTSGFFNLFRVLSVAEIALLGLH